jgi:hypothetical protein
VRTGGGWYGGVSVVTVHATGVRTFCQRKHTCREKIENAEEADGTGGGKEKRKDG